MQEKSHETTLIPSSHPDRSNQNGSRVEKDPHHQSELDKGHDECTQAACRLIGLLFGIYHARTRLRCKSTSESGQTQHTYFTAPSGPASINNEDDAAESARHCLEALLPLLETHDAFLVCCYSAHPLVGQLKARPEVASRRKPVTGIFEASVSSSLQAIGPGERFGIISTGKVWEAALSEAVDNYLGVEDSGEGSAAFAGVQTTGLNASELHETPAGEVRNRMKKAVTRLLEDDTGGRVGAVCLGCAGMAGFDDMVREAAVETLGLAQGSRVRIVDGVVAGVAWLEGALRSGM